MSDQVQFDEDNIKVRQSALKGSILDSRFERSEGAPTMVRLLMKMGVKSVRLGNAILVLMVIGIIALSAGIYFYFVGIPSTSTGISGSTPPSHLQLKSKRLINN